MENQIGKKPGKVLLSLFFSYLRVGTLTFGGGLSMLPIIERELCSPDRPLLTTEQLTDDYALAQCVPGIIMVNTSILTGYQIAGIPGAILAGLTVCLPSLIVILAIAMVLERYINVPVVANALLGIRCGVCALILNTVRKLWKTNIIDRPTVALFAVVLFLMIFCRISPFIPVVAGAVAGIIIKSVRTRS